MKKLKTAFKRPAIAGGCLLSLALLVCAFLNWRAGVCLEEQFQPLREAGEPMSIADLAPPTVPPERNALTYLRRAEKSVLAMNQELSPLREKHDDYYERGRLNQRGIDLVEAALNAYPDAIPLIQQAADAPEYVPDHDYTLPPPAFLEPYLENVQQSRAFARLLQHRGEAMLARQEREQALRNGLVLLRLDRHFQKEPMLVAYLVSVAVQSMGIEQVAVALEDGPVSADLHDQVDAEVSRHLASRAFVSAIESDRAYGIDSFRGFRSLGPPGRFKRDECDYLRRMAKEIEIGTLPRYQSENAVAQMNADTQGAGPLTMNMLPALEAAREAHQRSLARLKCLSVLNALTRQTAVGKALPTLDDLNVRDDSKVDPYNGRPLTIKRLDAGWLVYSVGPNLKDDGGQIDKSEDVGVEALR